MLVLARKAGESISMFVGGTHVGRATVVSIDNGRVRLAFHFDPSVRIVRDEILDTEKELKNDRVPALV